MTNWENSWSMLCHLCTQYDLWWVCISNFNEILKVDEKSRGPIRPERQMQEFHNCLDFCGFKDLGYTSLPFTWCNRRFNGLLMWVRLDRALASMDCFMKFPSAYLHHLLRLSWDHKPIWLVSDDIHSRFHLP